MNRLIVAIGFALITGVASANHTNYTPSVTAGATITQRGVGTVNTVNTGVAVRESRRRDIITDPRSCVEKWGEECIPATPEPVKLDLSGQSTADFVVEQKPKAK